MSQALLRLWEIGLAGGVAVALLLVVALRLVRDTARRIDAGGKAVWTEGKRVAQNTVQILLLKRTNALALEIAADSEGVLRAVRRIATHAEGCPGCPDCLVAFRKEMGGR